MTPPRHVQIGPFRYTLAIGGKHYSNLAVREGEVPGGYCDYDHLVIAIKPGLAPDVTRETVLHEIIHACGHAAGVKWTTTGDDAEEDTIESLSPTLLAALRDNPRLATYLLDA